MRVQNNIMTINLTQPNFAYRVDTALGWTVKIIQIIHSTIKYQVVLRED